MFLPVLKRLQFLWPYLIIIMLSLPGIWTLLTSGFFANHDGIGHIIRLSEFDLALKDGQIPVRWSKNLYFGFGYPFFNFNYPLTYYFGEIFHLLGTSFTEAIKLVMVSSVVLSGIFMYLWQKDYWGKLGGLTAAILYMYAPYRLLNVYVRGSVAESLAFVFIPLLFYFTEKIAEEKRVNTFRSIILGSFSFAFLILTHNISAFIFTIILGIFMLFHVVLKRKLSLIFSYFFLLLGGFLLSAYFWLPAILEKKYTYLDKTIALDFPSHFVYFWQFFDPKWAFGSSVPGPNDGLSFQLGIVYLVIIFLSVPALFYFKNSLEKKSHVFFYLAIFALAIFLMMEPAKFLWTSLPLLPFVQFPWRFLSWTTFAVSILGGFLVYALNKNFKRIGLLFFALLIAFLFFFEKEFWKPNRFLEVVLKYDEPIAGTTTWADEQAPNWLVPKPTAVPANRIEILTGSATINQTVFKTGLHEYLIKTETGALLVDNTAYYPGWQVLVDKKTEPIFYQGIASGRIGFLVPAGTHLVEVKFEETLTRLISDIVSLMTFLILIGLLFYPRLISLWRKKQ